ncbi:hypothetical protein AAFF_G00274390 [Aldrovandia affinis]|uniref:Uncharacterized protein n=1 Tax=Aldrovandia affinis TaxID=143900 RepID=A0AAD7SRN1_9TELE|nr:hypothetical protein AAFF_G00274390 [Aldrovandia affinis]
MVERVFAYKLYIGRRSLCAAVKEHSSSATNPERQRWRNPARNAPRLSSSECGLERESRRALSLAPPSTKLAGRRWPAERSAGSRPAFNRWSATRACGLSDPLPRSPVADQTHTLLLLAACPPTPSLSSPTVRCSHQTAVRVRANACPYHVMDEEHAVA